MKLMTFKMKDGSTWGVPVDMIARNRAQHYADEFNGDVEESLREDTIPLFKESEYEIADWAVNNMNFSDFDGHAVKVCDAPPLTFGDFQDAWLEAEKSIEDIAI